MWKLLIMIALTFATMLATASCGAVMAALPSIVAAVSDGIILLDQIEHFVDSYFAAHPDKDKQEKVGKALAKARAALNAANRATAGVDDLSKQQVDAAFAEFKQCYRELYVMLNGFGIVRPTDAMTATVGADGVLEIPDPLAFSLGKGR